MSIESRIKKVESRVFNKEKEWVTILARDLPGTHRSRQSKDSVPKKEKAWKKSQKYQK